MCRLPAKLSLYKKSDFTKPGMKYICSFMRVSKYWLFQGLGWFLFAFLNIYVAVITGDLSITVFLVDILLSFVGLWLSHRYRAHILKGKWLLFPTEKLLRFVFLYTALLSLIFTIGFYLLQWIFVNRHSVPDNLADLFGTFVAVYVLFALWNAIYFAWNYIERNRFLLINRLRLESEMKDLEIRTIRANLQPHFIFNALNSIRALIDENPTLARDAVTKISNILRSSIQASQELNELGKEVKLVEDYLDLEKIRFEERLQFSKQIDPETLSFPIPAMMLQTVVENAIKHGISASEQGGEIQLETRRYENTVELKVSNTGTYDPSHNREDSLSFGIRATQQRLQHFYGEQATFRIQQNGRWVETHIHIPIQNIPS